VISEVLHDRHPDDDEGVLSARRAAIVSTAGLARLARRIGLGEYLLLGEGEDQRGGRARPVLLAAGLEALAGAVFLDLGWERARAWLADLAAPELIAEAAAGTLKSPKSRLQELTQRRSGARPDYRLVEVSGPDHQRSFVVEVAVDGRIAGAGSGASRRSAETAAAAAALETLAGERRDDTSDAADAAAEERRTDAADASDAVDERGAADAAAAAVEVADLASRQAPGDR
jgi:ribonuclease III